MIGDVTPVGGGDLEMEVMVGGRQYVLSETLHRDELAPIFADAWTASRVWHASTFLSERLVELSKTADDSSQHHHFNVDSNGRAVIELGSGCGLVGLVAAASGAYTVLTDQREAIDLLKRNAEQNMRTDDERQRVHVVEYQWGTPPTNADLPRSTFDYILVSDCINPIYGVESWRNLARSIHMLSSNDTITYLAHEARGDDAAMVDFLEFSTAWLQCERIDHVPAKRLSLFKIRRLSD